MGRCLLSQSEGASFDTRHSGAVGRSKEEDWFIRVAPIAGEMVAGSCNLGPKPAPDPAVVLMLIVTGNGQRLALAWMLTRVMADCDSMLAKF